MCVHLLKHCLRNPLKSCSGCTEISSVNIVNNWCELKKLRCFIKIVLRDMRVFCVTWVSLFILVQTTTPNSSGSFSWSWTLWITEVCKFSHFQRSVCKWFLFVVSGNSICLSSPAARNHVNRMCLAADIPLIESGTAGYLGQVTVIKKVRWWLDKVFTSAWTARHGIFLTLLSFFFFLQGVTECYECQPKPTQKTFPGCTIRNTPSEPIHCIVWAKYLFKYAFCSQHFI